MSEKKENSRLFSNLIRNCCISTCNNVKIRGVSDDLVFHRFPSDQTLLKQWLRKCGIEQLTIMVNNRVGRNYWVCSDHFTKDDYRGNGKCLCKNAVPSQNLPILDIIEGNKKCMNCLHSLLEYGSRKKSPADKISLKKAVRRIKSPKNLQINK